jgi:hypothetical protein
MHAVIRVSSHNYVSEFASLWDWLRSERDLQGAVRVVQGKPGEEELGGALDALTVALESGGAGTVLAGSLFAWLKSRRTDVSITVECKEKSIKVDVKGAREALPILQEVLRCEDES